MKPLLSAIICFFTLATHAQNKKAIFVIVDGIPADVIEKLNTPTLDSISKVGGFTKAFVGGEKNGYSQTPTISAVGYNTILTGTWVNKHNVFDNDIVDPNYHYKTIFKLLKEQDSTKKTAIFSSWIDNRTKLVGEGLEQTEHLKVDHHVDGLELDTVRFPHDKQKDYMHLIDETVVDSASAYIRSSAPDLTWVYLEYTDDMGHLYGDGDKFYNAVEMMDKQMERLWSAIRYREKEFKEDWLIIITTDHGRDSATGKHHGGQSPRERAGWIVTNAKELNHHFRSGDLSIADIMPTIASFINLKIKKEDAMETDGIKLTGRIGASSPSAEIKNGKLNIRWKKLEEKGKATIWLSLTNNYKTGGRDKYLKMGTAALSRESFTIDLSKYPSRFYKVVIETPYNYLNRWVLQD